MTKFGQTQSTGGTNPVKYFLDWKSDKEGKTGRFKGWNKDLEQVIEVNDVSEFIMLMATNCVKGWDDATYSPIYSNEVINLKNEELCVKCNKGEKTLYKGLYDKEKLNALGCKFNKGIVALEADALIEYYMSGAALFTWNEDTANIDYNNYKIKFKGVEERKKGAITYYVPRWEQGSKITDEERKQAEAMVELLDDYHKSKND